MRRSPKVGRAPVISGFPGPEHCCFLDAGSSLFTTGHWKGLSAPFLEPNIKFLIRQKCRHNVKSRKIKANYSTWYLKPSKVQQNPFGITFVYIIYPFKRKQSTPGDDSVGNVEHAALGMLLLLLSGVSWPFLTLPGVMLFLTGESKSKLWEKWCGDLLKTRVWLLFSAAENTVLKALALVKMEYPKWKNGMGSGFALSWGWDCVSTWDPFKLKLFFGFLWFCFLWISLPRGAKESTSWRKLSVYRL